MGLDDGYTLVKIGRRSRKVKKKYFSQLIALSKKDNNKADNIQIIQRKYTGNAPLPPPELYHGKGAVTPQTVVGKSIYFYKIKIQQDLQSTDAGQSPPKEFQTLYGVLKKSDPDILLVPVTSNEAGEAVSSENNAKVGDYIDPTLCLFQQ